MLKKTIIALLLMTTTALADYNLIVPQKPSGGTSVWAQIVVAEWEKHLGEKINLIYKPGARDQLGPNEFQNKLRFDDRTILVLSGHRISVCSGIRSVPVGLWHLACR